MRIRKSGLVLAALVLSIAATSAQAQFGPTPAQGVAPTVASEDHRIAPADRLRINVFRMADLSLGDVQVDARGEFVMPVLGPVQAKGKTVGQLTDYLTDKLKAELRDPIVTVTLLEIASEPIQVTGSVTGPNSFKVGGPTTLLSMITAAGGTEKDADLKNVLVMRTTNGVRTYAKFDYGSIRRGRAEDPRILPGDIIVVENSRLRSVWSQVMQTIPALALFTAL